MLNSLIYVNLNIFRSLDSLVKRFAVPIIYFLLTDYCIVMSFHSQKFRTKKIISFS